MNYKVYVTETAKQDLREIAYYLAEQSKDVAVAKRFIMELLAEINKLTDFPYSGGIPKDRIMMSAGFRFKVHKDYLIFYNISEDEKSINVLAVFNGKKDYMRVMQKFI